MFGQPTCGLISILVNMEQLPFNLYMLMHILHIRNQNSHVLEKKANRQVT